jgi:hypothetical protein
MMEYDIHTVLDFLTLAATAWVIYELILPLKDTYQGDQDTIQWYYVVRMRKLASCHFQGKMLKTMSSKTRKLAKRTCARPCLTGMLQESGANWYIFCRSYPARWLPCWHILGRIILLSSG